MKRWVMATRPVFIPLFEGPTLIEERPIDFQWHPGMSIEQKRKNIAALHAASGLPRVLEISTRSTVSVGRKLSAFNLRILLEKGTYPLESVYQSSKVFKNLGAFQEISLYRPAKAKRFIRECVREPLIGFLLEGRNYPLEPKNAFYDWLYIRCLGDHAEWIRENVKYDGFTDIEYNPKKGINCQARAFAEYISLMERGQLYKVANDFETFVEILKNSEVLSAFDNVIEYCRKQ